METTETQLSLPEPPLYPDVEGDRIEQRAKARLEMDKLAIQIDDEYTIKPRGFLPSIGDARLFTGYFPMLFQNSHLDREKYAITHPKGYEYLGMFVGKDIDDNMYATPEEAMQAYINGTPFVERNEVDGTPVVSKYVRVPFNPNETLNRKRQR